MRDVRTNERTNEQGKIELLSFWMLDAEFRNLQCGFHKTQCYHLFWVTPASSARRTCILHQESEKFLSENFFLDLEMNLYWKRERGFQIQCAFLRRVCSFTQSVFRHTLCFLRKVWFFRHSVYLKTQGVSEDTVCF